MVRILSIVGALALGWQLLGGKVTDAILAKVDYRFSKIPKNGIRLDVSNGQLVGILRLEILFRQSFGLNLATRQLRLQLSQQGRHLGQVTVNEPVALPNATTVPIPVDVLIPAGSFLNRIVEVLENPNARWQAPLDIRGSVTLSNGQAIPVFTRLDFMNL
ncbi:MAG: hypothetical protein AAGA31_04305 [Bacteroidota bacterium]